MYALKNPKTNKYFQGYTLGGDIIESDRPAVLFSNKDHTTPLYIPDIAEISGYETVKARSKEKPETYPKYTSDWIFDNEVSIQTDATSLSGYEEGQRIYQEQIKDKIDLTDPFYIRFPDNVEAISTSFIEGLFDSIIEEVGIHVTITNTTIISIHPRIGEKIFKVLEVE